MSVGKKVNLPLLDKRESDAPKKKTGKKPSVEAARARLGGRLVAEDAPPPGLAPGVVVDLTLPSGLLRAAVVVFAGTKETHVLFDGMRLRRVAPAALSLHEGEVAEELARIAADARLFGMIVEGMPVRYSDDEGKLVDGKVVEKCRWGALVLRDDGAVIAVGFRKLWPAPTGSEA